MEAANTLTLPKEAVQEIFFREEATRIRKAFANKSDEEDLSYLLHQLQCMKSLMAHLRLPWDRLIPVLFRSFAYYCMRQPNEAIGNRKAYQLTVQLMDSVNFMSQNGRMINTLVEFFNHQIDDLDKLLAEEAKAVPARSASVL